MKEFSKSWKSSAKPRKQRRYAAKTPLHIKRKFASSHLSKELMKKHGMRSLGLRKGDKVKVMRGQFKKHEGKVDSIDLKKTKVFVSGVEMTKKDGTKKRIALHPSNLMITELNMDDKLRQKKIERK